uniref:Uncharacterized protein n=1 Tax=Parascaris equorum TaxID=6256 RepID=A0A914RF60_PAREQ
LRCFLYDSQREVNVGIHGIESRNSSQYLGKELDTGKTIPYSRFHNTASKCIQVSVIVAFDENLLSTRTGRGRLFMEICRALLLN